MKVTINFKLLVMPQLTSILRSLLKNKLYVQGKSSTKIGTYLGVTH